MKKDYTHIVLLLDRSGSMSLIKADMDGGIKAFIDAQKLESGYCTVSAAQFDDSYETMFTRIPINEVKSIEINPRGLTALIDSMVRLINETGDDLSGLDEEDRPERVLFVTITDGGENASRNFKNEDLSKLLKEQEDTYNWNFTYIGANQDAFGTASAFGGRFDNSMNYEATTEGVTKMFSKLSDATVRYRSVDVQSLSKSSFQYTEEEQNDI